MIEYKPDVRLRDIYSDRWQKISQLFKKLDPELLLQVHGMSQFPVWRHENMPQRVYREEYTGPVFGLKYDYMSCKHDWYILDKHVPDSVPKWQYECRTKIDLFFDPDCRKDHLPDLYKRFPELEYFYQMLEDFVPDIQEAGKRFDDQSDRITQRPITLTLIHYSSPGSTDTDKESRMRWCFEKFGNTHADESLCAIHLGESQAGFYTEKDEKKLYYPELKQYNTLCFYGQYAANSGFTPVEHGVEYTEGNGEDRYSLILNLYARYKE